VYQQYRYYRPNINLASCSYLGHSWSKVSKMSLSPHREAHWSSIWKWIVRNFQFFIVFIQSNSVNIECLQSASVSGGIRTCPMQAPHRGFASGPLGHSVSRQTSWAIAPSSAKWKFLASPLMVAVNTAENATQFRGRTAEYKELWTDCRRFDGWTPSYFFDTL